MAYGHDNMALIAGLGAEDRPEPVFSKTDDRIPDKLAGDPRSPWFSPAAHLLGVRVDGVEVNIITAYDLKEHWFTKKGGGSSHFRPRETFEVFWKEKPSRQFLRQLGRR